MILSKKKKINDKKPEYNYKNFFLAAGRFTRQKNFIYLINEFAKFIKLYPDEKLLIIGEGELKKKMQNQINKINITNNVKILDYTENIYYFMINIILKALFDYFMSNKKRQ